MWRVACRLPWASASAGARSRSSLVTRHSLLWAGAWSLAVHAALLLGFVRPHASSSVSTNLSALQARLVTQVMSLDAGTPRAAELPVVLAAAAAPNPPAVTSTVTRGISSLAPATAPQSTPDKAAAQGLAPAPSYRASGEHDPPPRPLQSIDPVYPESAGMQEGSVVLRLLISSSGEVDEVAVVRATPPGLFEQSALQAFAKAKFSPGYFLGIPVKSQIFIEVGYTPINRGGAVSGQNR